MSHGDTDPGFDLDRAWDLHPQVSVRPEPFGALLYHFGTRRLSFLKDRALLDVVRALGEQPTARHACAAAGLGEEAATGRYAKALAVLASTRMLVERGREPADPADPAAAAGAAGTAAPAAQEPPERARSGQPQRPRARKDPRRPQAPQEQRRAQEDT